MRQLHVLYAGPVLAGRRSSLAALYGAHTHRLEGKKVRLSSGETILLNAMVPYTGSGFFTSLQEATRADHAWIREIALAVVAFLPTINGVVFVADSQKDRQDANLESLERILRDLSDAGLDGERLPFVFQCNKRDVDDVVPFAQMVASLSTPRCAHVQSVAYAGYGITQALDSLVVLLDRDASKTRTPASRLELAGAGGGQAPSSPHRLFEELTPQPTGDDEIRSVLRPSTQAPKLVLTHGAIADPGSIAPLEVPGLAPGRYAIDVVECLVFLPEPGEWQPQLISDRFIAARIRLRGAQVASHELMAVAPLGVPFVIGLPPTVGAAKYDDLAVEARAQAHEEGVTVVARRGSRLEPARSGEMAVFAVVARQIWIGRDGDGRVVEVAGYGDRRPAVLRIGRDGRRIPGRFTDTMATRGSR